MSNINALARRMLALKGIIEQRKAPTLQLAIMESYDPHTGEVLYRTPESELIPLAPGQPRTVLSLPKKCPVDCERCRQEREARYEQH